MEKLSCVSCGNYIVIEDGSVKFQCPGCGELIGRCGRCREQSNRYICKCGFEGP